MRGLSPREALIALIYSFLGDSTVNQDICYLKEPLAELIKNIKEA